MLTATKRMTLDEFLALPENEPPSEYICGEVVQKTMPSPYHSRIAMRIGSILDVYLAQHSLGWSMVEPRHAERSEHRAYLPDVAVVLSANLPSDERVLERGPLEIVPDIAIEVLSPDDRPGRVAEKVAFYLRNNTPLTWVIDPLERTVDVHRPGLPSAHFVPGDTLEGEPVLPGFTLDVAELFASLSR